MTEQIQNEMNNLNLNQNQSQSQQNDQRRSYIPPHLRNRQGSYQGSDSDSSGSNRYNSNFNNYDNNSNSNSFFRGRGAGRSSFNRSPRTGYRGGRNVNYGPRPDHYHTGRFIDGKQVPGPRNDKIELELFGAVEDPTYQSSGINFDNYDEIPVEATGSNVPDPITSFTSPPLDDLLLENVKLARFTKPTPVQKYSVPIIAAGRDLMACAQTGSGKTGGFLFPTLSESFKNGPRPVETPQDNQMNSFVSQFTSSKVYPSILILAPTRELVSQIFDEAKKFCYRSWMRPCVVYGGSDISSQIKNIQRGCDILAATPGRLNDLLERGRVSLKAIKYLVLDEADRMLDMGFEPQIRSIVEQNDMPGVNDRTTLMFSATFPKDIQVLARDFLKDYIFLSVGRVGSTSENITQRIIYVDDNDKNSVLLDILSASENGLTLIFVETKKMADTLSNFLILQQFPATSIHGDRSQSERERALEMFRTNKASILVATAVAARGLDIPNVTHVINYDLPTDIDDYVHRIGRTGRAGNTGVATAFFNRNNRNIVRDLIDILSEANQEVPDFLLTVNREGLKPKRGGGRTTGTRDYRRQNNSSNGGNWYSNSSSNGWNSFGSQPSGQSRYQKGGSSQPLSQQGYGNPSSQNSWW
ncbi:DEAD/DEAH box helicase [Ascoidea rubescens DSM 1968]|uniref:RNA helicase n=1 Tax=Ascoidea rubescens DSM 1968 TaxID=1344418 RepID=A0A1D2VGF6_9ASCO|nr:P-loop containing nucleoside triphosphate hydrolase protein [Ascoidea rubescens DSM 1968]ODV60715.1 P-loop containing nucleoside triphosphate hydrolase protein [Ascoidea rubescens DSM 1968]